MKACLVVRSFLVGTLNSFEGIQEIKTSHQTKRTIAEGHRLPIRVTPPSSACEPVLEVETDVADSGAQSGSVSDSWLVKLSMMNLNFFPSQRVRVRASVLL